MDFIETFPYMIKYKEGKENVVADVLSRRYALLNTLNSKLLGLGFIKELYLNYNDFGIVFNTCANGAAFNDFYVFDGYLYKKNRLCISSCSMYEILVKEAHAGGLIGHFRVHKTYDILIEHFISPCMKRDVNNMCGRCIVGLKTKSKLQPYRLYTPLPIPDVPCTNLSVNFGILRLHGVPRTIDLLPYVEFAYSRVVHRTTHYSPFKIVYGFNPLTLIDIVPLPLNKLVSVNGSSKADLVKGLHE
ncbi:uncharacterized protein LOC125369551 [Ricinus communis]|uniref:uncharacterized protein LOC125369551 n=1 Tax=Ricinus communis TaxID=3988 RepID=UPI00201B3153|nr:uncharacterized protein LOC125369551 [Ricinus communis]